jgi:hypothetical protein
MTDTTLDQCLIVYKNSNNEQLQEVQVTSKQLKKIHKHLQASYAGIMQIEIIEDNYKQILYSPCHLWEILLEDYGVSNNDVEFN